MRYVLPAFPFAFVWCSKVARSAALRDYALSGVASLALLWFVSSSLLSYPHSLSYFNELVGGPKNGHAHLLNSNIDWGQDVLFLKRWMDKHPDARPIAVTVFPEWFDLRVAGIHADAPPPGPNSVPEFQISDDRFGPKPGWYALSANRLRHRERQFDYFLIFQPVATAGYSIYIYHITPDEANRARQELGLCELSR